MLGLHTMTNQALYVDPDIGRVFMPHAWTRSISRRGSAMKAAHGEICIATAKHFRPILGVNGELLGRELLNVLYGTNERVDKGAAIAANRQFGYTAGGTANGVFTAVAIASAAITVGAANLSLGSNSADVTTNEFTTIGLSRAAGTLGTYTAPASLGAVFSLQITKTHTASGSGTAHGMGLFDQVVVASSNLYFELLYSNGTAVLASGDSLASTATISN